MTAYERYRALGLDGACLGLEPGDENGGYFCTPVGARVIGWDAGGVHFCFVDGQGQTVFAVNPMPAGERSVYPVARSFEDFARLMLACGGTAAVEQAEGWDRAQFDAFLGSPQEQENRERPDVRRALDALAAGLNLAPMPDPFGYIQAVQAEFDDRALRFSDEYYEVKGLDRPETFTGNEE